MNANMKVNKGQLNYRLEKHDYALPYEKGSFTSTVSPKGLQSKLIVNLTEKQHIKASFALPDYQTLALPPVKQAIDAPILIKGLIHGSDH